MNILEYCVLAISKDPLKPNITSVYRDTTRMVGTDGSRLHMVEVAELPRGFFLDNNKENFSFPEYSRVVPASDPLAQISIKISSKKQVKEIITLIQLVNRLAQKITGQKVPAVFLEASKEKELKIQFDGASTKLDVFLTPYFAIPDELDLTGVFRVALDASFLVDALKIGLVDEEQDSRFITFQYHGETKPFVIKSKVNENNTTAILMPLRVR